MFLVLKGVASINTFGSESEEFFMLTENIQDVTNDVIRRVLKKISDNKQHSEKVLKVYCDEVLWRCCGGAVDTVEVSFVLIHCPSSTFRFIAVNMFPSHFCRYASSDHLRFLNFPLSMPETFKFAYSSSGSHRDQSKG